MATGRTVLKHTRVYINGYDMSGYARSFGELVWSHEAAELAGFTQPKGYLPDQVTITPSTLNAVLDTDAQLWSISSAGGDSVTFLAPFGIRAAPAAGDPAFMGAFRVNADALELGGGVYYNAEFGMWDVNNLTDFSKPWGVLLHPDGAETAVNSSTGVDDNGASSTNGGFMAYQVLAGDGTATIKVQHAATNSDGSFADLTGATSGVIDCSTPTAGVAATATGLTVNRYLRWQIVLGTATTVTFVLSFSREIRNFT